MLDAYIYDGLRSPIGRHAGKLAPLRPDDLAGDVIREVVKRNAIDPAEISDIVQMRIATPEDLDRAVMLGLGYPKGPLAMGDAVGAKKILAVLQNMHELYQEPRYRPSPWLRRRAQLGASLLTPEN